MKTIMICTWHIPRRAFVVNDACTPGVADRNVQMDKVVFYRHYLRKSGR